MITSSPAAIEIGPDLPVSTPRVGAMIRLVAAAASFVTVASPASAQETAELVPSARRAVFVGERSLYEVKFGKLRVGEAAMEVLDGEAVRGRNTWHTSFRIRGGVPFYRVNDLLESWIDQQDFVTLRFHETIHEGGRERKRAFEIYPDRRVFQEDDQPEETSISNPLDEGSFLYFVRTIPLEVGQTYTFDRYFRPDRNPVVVRVLAKETIRVPAGTYSTIVIQPVIKAKGIFSEKGEARIWLTDDDRRIMVQLKSKTKIGSLNLHLKSYRPTIDRVPAAATK
jgi:hypothetical protein